MTCGCFVTGEGYESTVTVDDEDSKVIIYDNWKQVSSCPIFFFSLQFTQISGLQWFCDSQLKFNSIIVYYYFTAKIHVASKAHLKVPS